MSNQPLYCKKENVHTQPKRCGLLTMYAVARPVMAGYRFGALEGVQGDGYVVQV